jgi:hypothetical protein
MAARATSKDQLDILGKLVHLGGGNRVMAQTISKLLDYAIEQHQRDPEGVTAKLRAREEQFGTLSALLYQKFHSSIRPQRYGGIHRVTAPLSGALHRVPPSRAIEA